MSHDEAGAKASLRWALIDGRDDGDFDFQTRRDAMKSAALDRDNTRMYLVAPTMFVRHAQDEANNLIRSEQEDPGSLVRWSREILGLPA